MNLFDILIWLILLYALYNGWSRGLLMQLSGIVGVILGAWVASRFSIQITEWFGVDVGGHDIWVFIIIMIGVMIVVTILVKLLNKVLEFGGLSLPLKLLGSVFSAIKYFVILSLFLACWMRISSNFEGELGNESVIKKSFFYKPFTEVNRVIFPYIIKGLTIDGASVFNTFDRSSKISPSDSCDVTPEITTNAPHNNFI